MPTPLEPPISIEAAGSATVVVVRGELDLATKPDLDEALDAALERRAPVVVDLTDCSFMDSAGPNSFVRVQRHAHEGGVGLAVVCPPGSEPEKVMRIALAGVVEVHPDRPSALGALRPRGTD